MTKLACYAGLAAQEMAIREDSGANSLRDVDNDQVMHPVAISEPHFRQSTRIGNIVDDNRKAGGSFDTRLQLPDGPVHVWRKDGFFKVWIKAPWKIDADALECAIRMSLKHLLDGSSELPR